MADLGDLGDLEGWPSEDAAAADDGEAGGGQLEALVAAGEPVRTVRITSIPPDVSEREFNGWFLFASGFEEGVLLPQGDGPQLGWARFDCEGEAAAAVRWLSGRQLPERQAPSCPRLGAELAKSDLRIGHPIKRPRTVEPRMVPPPAWATLAVAAAVAPDAAPAAEVSTLFVWGVSSECTQGEIAEFFQGNLAGFEKLHMGRKGTCFVKFQDPQQASDALLVLELNSLTFPSSPEAPIRAELAKNDLFQRGAGAPGAAAAAPARPVRPLAPPILPCGTTVAVPRRRPQPSAAPQLEPEADRGATPCDTMFIGGLSADTQEDELRGVLEGLHGFHRLKVALSGRSRPMAWALFDSVEACTEALAALQGVALASSPTHVIGCEYAKSSLDSFGRRG